MATIGIIVSIIGQTALFWIGYMVGYCTAQAENRIKEQHYRLIG